MTEILRTDGLTRHFGQMAAVDDLSFSLKKGELLAMIGPNGAGKTTCFNLLMGQLAPSAGKVLIRGQDVTGFSPRKIWKMGVGRTFQITAIYPSMTVAENVQMALLAYHKRLYSFLPYAHRLYRSEALEVLGIVGMAQQADRHCAVLAYGDLKRLELAMSLAQNPDLLLMDEPTAGMASQERGELMQLIADLVEERGMSVLFTEHDMDVVFAHAHRVIVLNRGQLIADGTVEEVRQNPLVQEVYLGGGSLFHKANEGHHA